MIRQRIATRSMDEFRASEAYFKPFHNLKGKFCKGALSFFFQDILYFPPSVLCKTIARKKNYVPGDFDSFIAESTFAFV